jgi:serine/threonine-protein kinase PpkA
MTLDIAIAGYLIKEEIGRGGMATVYRALQESLHRDVALKIMSPSLASDDGFKKRFNNEGHIIAQLSHSNIVTIFDIGNYQHYYYFSMEFLPGGTLRDKITQGLPLTEANRPCLTVWAARPCGGRAGSIQSRPPPRDHK